MHLSSSYLFVNFERNFEQESGAKRNVTRGTFLVLYNTIVLWFGGHSIVVLSISLLLYHSFILYLFCFTSSYILHQRFTQPQEEF